MRHWLPLVLLSLATACAHHPRSLRPNAVVPLERDEYGRIVSQYTSKADQYSGFYQTFQADVTILNSEVLSAALRQRGAIQQWDEKQYQTEREKMLQDNSAYAKFFLRFYSPDRDFDDMGKGKSVWKVYLDISGQRLEGKVKKLKDKYLELQTIYPHYDHFSTPYEITFNVPMATVENAASKVTLASSLGTAEFSFPGKK